MEIEIIKRLASGKEQTEYLKILKTTTIRESRELLAFTEEHIEEENGEKKLNVFINKVQFIASCKTRLEDEIIVAFYLNEGELKGFILSDIGHEYLCDYCYLIDYKGYCEICDLTGEKKISLIDYYHYVKSSQIGINTYVKHEDKYLNYDEQQSL